MAEPDYHAMPDGRRIAFRHAPAVGPADGPNNGPAIVFLPGYMSDMEGGKALALFAWAQEHGRECLLLDYSGCGASEGEFAHGTLSRWCEEVLALIEVQLHAERVILVGSSMGGWLMLLAGLALGDRLVGLVGIAAAPDFTDWGYSAEQKEQLRAGATLFEDNPYGSQPTPTHPAFWSDGERRRVLDGPVDLGCPVRLLHGQDDADVPPEISLRLAAALASPDVQVTLVKGGDHRLSREGDIALLLRSVSALVEPGRTAE